MFVNNYKYKKVLEITTFFRRISLKGLFNALKSDNKKKVIYGIFVLILVFFFVFDLIGISSENSLTDNSQLMQTYNEQLADNRNSTKRDSLILTKERDILISEIEERVISYLYQISDYSYIKSLEPYLKISPEILNQIPSAVPLEKGDYRLSSVYGYRLHPITGKNKKHFGVDFAAPEDKEVYATASGVVLKVEYLEKGYGTHIIIKHRFGFHTLYGHLNKVLVREGQNIKQHELIASVGSSGTSTGYHLHYEVIKNNLKINPIYGFNLKRNVLKNSLNVSLVNSQFDKEENSR